MTVFIYERGWDAAFCPDPAPDQDDGYSWCEVYIGGSSATRRTGWNVTERARVADLPKLPVWVPTPGRDNPRQSALDCLYALRIFGVPAWATPWRAVMWDMETGTLPDPAWFKVAHGVMMAAGYGTVSYGSQGWAFGEPNYLGMIIADPDGTPDFRPLRAAHPDALIVGKQYKWQVDTPGGVIDQDALDPAFMPHLGRFLHDS
jgi:hypothetical protein